MTYCNFWGKAHPLAEDSAPFHPIAYHSLDVAATGQVLLQGVGIWRARLAELLDLEDNATSSLVTFLLALHDIGKFSKPFQAKVPSLWPANAFGPLDGDRIPATPYHDTAGWVLWDTYLSDKLSKKLITPDAFHPLVRAVTGHHGSPPENEQMGTVRSIFGASGRDAATEFALDAATLLLEDPIGTDACEQNINTASYALAGIATLADWIGSNQEWFGYHQPGLSLGEYWENVALPRARKAVPQTGLNSKSSSQRISYRALAGVAKGKHFSKSPMQNWTERVKLPEGPSFFIIEDMTGAGKTEAAMMLAHRLISGGKADGLFLTLPTQATANAMYERLGNAYRMLFDPQDAPSLILAHGARDLHEGFSQSILNFTAKSNAYYEKTPASEVTASAQCAEWVADDRRLSFLADVGVGTIDQALLAILPSRHQGLRLAGLMRRVLILDEIHAYDAYMQEEICTLISFHASLGGCTILLSATLPKNMKERLCAAFHDGRGDVDIIEQNPAPYPLMTYWAGDRFETYAASPRAGTERHVPVRFLHSLDKAIERAREAAREGQAVLYIRNSVDYAIEAFERLKGDVPHTTLFHARYALCDRIAQENTVLESFGKKSQPDRRAGRLLVATQVVEQSLDLDFDLVL